MVRRTSPRRRRRSTRRRPRPPPRSRRRSDDHGAADSTTTTTTTTIVADDPTTTEVANSTTTTTTAIVADDPTTTTTVPDDSTTTSVADASTTTTVSDPTAATTTTEVADSDGAGRRFVDSFTDRRADRQSRRNCRRHRQLQRPRCWQPRLRRSITSATPGNRNVTVRWNAPTNTGGSPITGYVVQISTSPTTGFSNVGSVVPASARSVTTGTLTAGRLLLPCVRPQRLRLEPVQRRDERRAVGSGRSGRSPSATPGNGNVTVRWNAPTNTGGSPITGYVVQISTSPTTGFSNVGSVVPASARSVTTGTLTAGRYYFRVYARNAYGWSPSSAVMSAVLSVPGAPVITVGDARQRQRDGPLECPDEHWWVADHRLCGANARPARRRDSRTSAAWCRRAPAR